MSENSNYQGALECISQALYFLGKIEIKDEIKHKLTNLMQSRKKYYTEMIELDQQDSNSSESLNSTAEKSDLSQNNKILVQEGLQAVDIGEKHINNGDYDLAIEKFSLAVKKLSAAGWGDDKLQYMYKVVRKLSTHIENQNHSQPKLTNVGLAPVKIPPANLKKATNSTENTSEDSTKVLQQPKIIPHPPKIQSQLPKTQSNQPKHQSHPFIPRAEEEYIPSYLKHSNIQKDYITHVKSSKPAQSPKQKEYTPTFARTGQKGYTPPIRTVDPLKIQSSSTLTKPNLNPAEIQPLEDKPVVPPIDLKSLQNLIQKTKSQRNGEYMPTTAKIITREPKPPKIKIPEINKEENSSRNEITSTNSEDLLQDIQNLLTGVNPSKSEKPISDSKTTSSQTITREKTSQKFVPSNTSINQQRTAATNTDSSPLQYTPTFSQIDRKDEEEPPDLSDIQKMIREAARKDPNQKK